MKISAVPSLGNSVSAQGPEQSSRVEALRVLKMNTNATPGLAGPPTEDEKLSIPDNNEASSTVEATQAISPQFAALAKQRRALQVKERELSELRKELESKSQGSDYIPKSRLKTETLKVLQEAGVSYDDLTQAILSNPIDEKYSSLEAKYDALEKSIEKKLTERDTQAYQQTVANIRGEVTRLVNQGDTYELVRATGSSSEVVRLIEETYKASGEILDEEEACQLVEDELFRRNQKIASLKKMQSLFAPVQPAQPPQQRSTGMRTLTNKDTASIPLSPKQRALAAFYGTLKK